jgi:hypothetical protein
MTCLECKNAKWDRTPTGRVRKSVHGCCGLLETILHEYTVLTWPPCIAMDRPRGSVIWHDTEANNCRFFEWLNP